MIGGIDTHLKTRIDIPSIQIAVRVIRQFWSDPVFENGLSGERYDSYWSILFDEIEELFVYPDSSHADQWDEEGAIPSLHNTMIHIVLDGDILDIVVDELDSSMAGLIKSIEGGLLDPVHSVTASTISVL